MDMPHFLNGWMQDIHICPNMKMALNAYLYYLYPFTFLLLPSVIVAFSYFFIKKFVLYFNMPQLDAAQSHLISSATRFP